MLRRVGLVTAMLLCRWGESGTAQQVAEKLGSLLGEWEGKLEYVDYKDDATRVRLPTSLQCRESPSGEAPWLQYTYTEPSGEQVVSRSTIRLTDDLHTLVFDGSWRIAEQSLDREAGRYVLVLRREGNDNNRPAAIRQTPRQEGNTLTLTKEVRYEGGGGLLCA